MIIAQIIDLTVRKPALQPNYSYWKPNDPQWKSIGVEWENSIHKFPEDFIIEQSDNGCDGSNTFWKIKNANGRELVNINHKKWSQGPYCWIRGYTYVFFKD